MKQKIEDHQKIQTYANTIKEIADTAVREHWKTNELKQKISEICAKCLSIATSDCEICNWHSIVIDSKKSIIEELNDIWYEFLSTEQKDLYNKLYLK